MQSPSSAGEAGQLHAATHLQHAPSPADPDPLREEVQVDDDILSDADPAAGRPPSASAAGQVPRVTHASPAPALVETIAAIRVAHRERCFWMEQRKRANLALGAYVRTSLGWNLSLPAAERTAIAKEAQAIIAASELYVKAQYKAVAAAQKQKAPVDLPVLPENVRRFANITVPQIRMRSEPQGYDDLEAVATRDMEQLARQLPVAEWTAGVRGLGMLGLAIIVGEAGDLHRYDTPAKLWTRMGVGMREGRRQGGLPKGAPAKEWIAEKYSPQRRSRLYTIGDAMIKQPGPYREIYLDRKVYEKAHAEGEGLIVAPANKIPKGQQAKYRSVMHIHKRAQRYMEKKLLKHLWRAWRRVEGHEPSAGHEE